MHDDRVLLERRLHRALEERIRPAQYAASISLVVDAWQAPEEPVPFSEAVAQTFAPVRIGDGWGPAWRTTWFRLRGEVPAVWAGRKVEVVLDLGFTADNPGFQAEGLIYDLSGSPIKGIHPRNRHVPVADPAVGGERIDLLLEAAANPAISLPEPTDLGDRLTAPETPIYRLRRADVAVLDEEAWGLALDIEVLSELMAELPVDDTRRHQILRALERMLDRLDLHDVAGSATEARRELVDVLSSPAHASAHRLSAVGHAHLDSAWLWPLRETERKAARTFANVTALTSDYPELVFACSQAQQYAWIKSKHPEIFERIKGAVRDGNWSPVGSMWVEADANMPGGEALVRQIVHGKAFFLEEFGIDTQEIWLPDSFGYTAAFPQLAKLAGVQWFLTQKLSWNQTNKMPHHTFWWEGIDGSRVFTHFPPVETYNCRLEASELAHAVRNYAEKGVANTSLVPFGYGDGGGGPTREMMEKARRLRDLEGSPRVVVESPARFYERAREDYPDAPVWSGELYLELHRATYTTQAKTKAGNRRSEHLLREAELWSTAAALRAGHEYPYDELDALWKTVLLHQFHDILPGSSIAWVHREARATYEEVRRRLEELVGAALQALAGSGGAAVVANAAPQDRYEVVVLAPGSTGDLVPTQKLRDGQVVLWATVGGSGTGSLEAGLPAGVVPVTAEETILDNGLLRVDIDADGLLASVHDLEADREVIAPGSRGNLLQLHPDHPNAWDAWDIDRHYLRQRRDLVEADSVTLVESGPLLARVEVRRSFGASRVTQTYTLAAGSRRLDIETEVDWRESEKVLKAAFDLDVQADRSASEIQFGHVHRPTHTNTSWDQARFEICAHRWVQVGETGYGVAIANDSTYGHDISRASREDAASTVVRLTLLRAPHSPDPHTDQDQHRFSYSVVPGAGVREAADAGYSLNLPLRPFRGSAAAKAVVRVENPAVRVESVKLAEDRSGDVVVRVYEAEGGRAGTSLWPGFDCAEAHIVDLLERPLEWVELVSGRVQLSLRPFEIVTLRLVPAS